MDSNKLTLLPLRDIVMFPHMIVPLFVGREMSIIAIEKALKGKKELVLVTQKEATEEKPTKDDIYDVGTLSEILQILKLPDGTVKILVKGLQRVKINTLTVQSDVWEVEFTPEQDIIKCSEEKLIALQRTAIDLLDKYVNLNKRIHPDIISSVNQSESASVISDIISTHLVLKLDKKQKLLEMFDLQKRFEMLLECLESEIKVLQVEKKIKSRVRSQMEKSQKEYYLNEQMKAIQRELSDADGETQDELADIKNKIKKAKMTKEAEEKANAELKKLRQMNPMSAEATVVRNYLDWLLDLPWSKKTRVIKDLNAAKKILDSYHSGLDKVKDRVLDYLAVQMRGSKAGGAQIICFMGPPGVGKTSLARAIADSVGRKFVRISLGGVKDESEIRGHRRTYIGSMPGKIIQALKKAGSVNPVILLDEIDKVGSDWKGDPSSALLEVLDSEQNNTFNDHYLEVDFDLSDVMFITTANTYDMPKPLLDRLEIIRLSGYTDDEKLKIAQDHLVAKQLQLNALTKKEASFSDAAIMALIRGYTREAGVRNLEREIANVLRKVTRKIVAKKAKAVHLSVKNIGAYAGVVRYKDQEANAENAVGIVTGLAWTEVGGEILSIEALRMRGKGNIIYTGKLGEVMQESIKAAYSLVKSRSINFGIEYSVFEKSDVHIHVPEGAIPKDGPSAGVAMVTAIVSVFSGIEVRKDVAMTGEITLRGKCLAIGGLKEKILAAKRNGIKTVIIPKDNAKDLIEIPGNIKNDLNIVLVSDIDELLQTALVEKVNSKQKVSSKSKPTKNVDEEGISKTIM